MANPPKPAQAPEQVKADAPPAPKESSVPKPSSGPGMAPLHTRPHEVPISQAPTPKVPLMPEHNEKPKQGK